MERAPHGTDGLDKFINTYFVFLPLLPIRRARSVFAIVAERKHKNTSREYLFMHSGYEHMSCAVDVRIPSIQISFEIGYEFVFSFFLFFVRLIFACLSRSYQLLRP